MFSDEEVHAAWQTTRDASNDDVRAVMAFTANLLATRGGTMTADEVRMRLARISAHNADDASALRGHFNEIGARNAGLETDVARLTQHEADLGSRFDALASKHSAAQEQITDLEKRLEKALEARDAARAETEKHAAAALVMNAKANDLARALLKMGGDLTATKSERDTWRQCAEEMEQSAQAQMNDKRAIAKERDELKASRDRLRSEAQELATLRDQMERDSETWRIKAAEYDTERNEAWAAYRKQDARANEAEDEVDRVSTERDALKSKVAELEERCARLSVVGQALSEHADKTAGGPLTEDAP